MKFTKIVSTIGPASETLEQIEGLIKAGVNVFRLNFKHGEPAKHEMYVHSIREVSQKLGVVPSIIMDLQGPSFRLILSTPTIELKKGMRVKLGTPDFTLTHPHIIPLLQVGNEILVDDGTIRFTVEEAGEVVTLLCHTDTIMKTRKSLNIPGVDFPVELLTERDIIGVDLAVKNQLDWVAVSFVRNAQDIKDVRAKCAERGYTGPLIAKLETRQCLDFLEEIVRETDAVMVARGDLAVESPIERVPLHQKCMIDLCLKYDKPVIVATQMMSSMEKNPFPTRAEVSDAANAIYDRTDAIMTSGETAAGVYPVETIQMMSKIAEFHEMEGNHYMSRSVHMELLDKPSRIAHAAYKIYQDYLTTGTHVKAFVVFTNTGRMARLLSHYRADAPIYAFTPSVSIAGRLALSYGVYPRMHDEPTGEVSKDQVSESIEKLKSEGLLKKGDAVIVTHGDYWGAKGGTSSLRIVEIS
ncbi:MAG: pyruvate kinase [bacterium]